MTNPKPLPSQEELHTLLEYRDGKLFRKVNSGPSKAGDEGGCLSGIGYRIISVKNKLYLEHRLIWIMHGNDPVDFLDHIDGDKLNNRIENLRPAAKTENGWNTKLKSNNTSGIKGVCWCKRRMYWYGRVRFKGKVHFAGYFKDKDECVKAVRELREKLHGDFANHG